MASKPSTALLVAVEIERRRRIKEAVAEVSEGGIGIPAEMTFLQWCDDLASRGMKIDGKPFSLDKRQALVPLYEAIPTTAAEAAGGLIVVQKATQLGMTVWEVLAMIYMAVKFAPVNIGLFLPDQATAAFKSEHRFMRIVRSVPSLLRRLIFRVDTDKNVKVGEGNILTRVMGESIFMFLWTTGKVTTESRPMDIEGLDEVQEMALADIDKCLARMGDSDIAFALMLSTANMPEQDINFWYMGGTQEVWHTHCGACDSYSDLSDPAGIFPDKSITYNTGQFQDAPVFEYVWTCPVCGAWIPDPQVGRLIAAKPAARYRSLLMPRVVSPKETPRLMLEGWSRAKTGDQKKSFYNRRLARPYIDAEQLPVTMTHCLAAAEAGMAAGVVWKTHARGTFMGIDQMGSFNVVIIKERLPDGRQATIHVEAIFNDDPFARCDVLMEDFGVEICVLETLPNVNDARRFANRFPGRVFLAGYADLRDDAMIWGDDLTKADRKTDEQERTRYTVTLNQYKCMQTALYRVRGVLVEGKLVPMCLFPDPDLLEQDVIDNGMRVRIPILRDWVFMHLTKTALVVEDDDEVRKKRAKVLKVGIDPHFSYANMLCDVAWARSHGTTMFIFPTKPDHGVEVSMPYKDRVLGDIPAHARIALMAEKKPEGEVCGRCTSFPVGGAASGRCAERECIVQAKDPGCPLFTAVV